MRNGCVKSKIQPFTLLAWKRRLLAGLFEFAAGTAALPGAIDIFAGWPGAPSSPVYIFLC
jgi:hypothetical protein